MTTASNSRTPMSFVVTAACVAAIAALAAAIPTEGQSSTANCPASYWKLDTVWSDDKGQVEKASGQSAADVAMQRGGKAESWQLGALCMAISTGDVRIFDAGAPTEMASAPK